MFTRAVAVGCLLTGLSLTAAGQITAPNPYPPTSGAARLESAGQRQRLISQSRVGNIQGRNVGPTVMSGRVVDLEVNPSDPTEFYVAYATGGLWHTTDNGISFTSIFDNAGAPIFLGDIAVDWKTRQIWVGTGENNSSRSSYAGTGMYYSDNNGKSWAWRGLPESHHISRVVLHPTDPNTLWVAVLGHLYSPNAERGVYKSTDGGRNWTRTLFVNDTTGAADLVIDPKDPNTLYASTWTRDRRAWHFRESGAGSGIWKSTDGGSNWTLISTPTSGFPTGPFTGRIGLDIYAGNSQVLYAVVDNNARTEDRSGKRLVTTEKVRNMDAAAFLALPADSISAWMDDVGFPQQYNAKGLQEQVKAGKLTPRGIAEFLSDANADLFNKPIVGAELYRSDDGGKSWKRTSDKPIADLFYTYGYYFAQVRVSPLDDKLVYLLGVPAVVSEDGGKTFRAMNSDNSHSDHHALWVSPTKRGYIVLGNDGGVNISYNNGGAFIHCNTPPVGQFYAVNVDNATPYNIYGGLQDNGVWVGPSTYSFDRGWYSEGKYPYERIGGGDGMQVQIDPRNRNVVYTGYQFGNYVRLDRSGNSRPKRVTPSHTLGEKPYRWNWQTPILLSPHNPDIFYMGANRLFRSFDKGDSFRPISPDLTQGGAKGNVPYGSITSFAESGLQFGLIYAGTDDGRVHVTRDGGMQWQEISAGLPANLWVSRVEVSSRDTATVWVSLNGYRWDHFEPYLYKSTDYGKTWTRLGTDLPKEAINVVRHDPANPNLLYVGTDGGLYVSLDGGKTFEAFLGGMPEVPVHDLVIHKGQKELVVGTHGRSAYVLPLGHVQQLTGAILQKPLHVFALDSLTHSDNWGRKLYTWGDVMEPKAQLVYYAAKGGVATLTVKNADGMVVRTVTDTAEAGLNFLAYDLTADERAATAAPAKGKKPATAAPAWKKAENGRYYLRPGGYTLELSVNGTTVSQGLGIKENRQAAARARRRTGP